MSGWQPIETAPKDGTSVLLFYPEAGVADGKWCKPQDWLVQHWCIHGEWTPTIEPTHWQLLPVPPADHSTATTEGVGG